MDWLNVLGRIETGEDSHTEFKSRLDFPNIGKAICAFANAEGGVVIIGISNARQIVGINGAAEGIQERLTSFLQSGCNVPVSARSGWHADPKGTVHWIEVSRQRGFEPMRYGGRVWVRRGRSSVEPSPSELQDLYNTFGYILTEEQTIQGATVPDIDLSSFYRYLRRLGFDVDDNSQPEVENDLRNRDVVADTGGELRATLYGILAFGKQPQSHPQTRNFCIDCAAYGGGDRADDVLQVSRSEGTLSQQVDRAAAWLRSLGRFESYVGLTREDRHLLPPRALREALVNAVVHRDYAITGSKVMLEVYDDRVEVTSPGTLPNNMTVEGVLAGANPRSRNESMAHFLAASGYMEERGRGWLVMRREMTSFNGTEPSLLEDRTNRFVRVTFRLEH